MLEYKLNNVITFKRINQFSSNNLENSLLSYYNRLILSGATTPLTDGQKGTHTHVKVLKPPFLRRGLKTRMLVILIAHAILDWGLGGKLTK